MVAAAALPSAASADTYTVTNYFEGDGSLRNQIAAAEAHPGPDTVAFAPSLTKVIVQGQITIDDPALTVTGNGRTKPEIWAIGDRGFSLTSAAVATFQHMSITEGRPRGNGGNFLNEGTLTLDDVLVTGGVAVAGGTTGQGGGVYNTGTLHVQDSSIEGNGARADNGPDGGQGAGIYNAGTATIERSSVSSNRVSGGGSFSGQGGTGAGGGIYNTGTLAITDSTIAKNEAAGGSDPNFPSGFAHGAGIENAGSGKLTIRNTTLNGNQAIGFGGSTSGATWGGAIANGGAASMDIQNSTFANNTAYSNVGAGARSFGGAIDNDSTAESTITGATFSGNAARKGATIQADRATLTLKSSILDGGQDLAGNPAANCGGPTLNTAGYNIESTDSCGLRKSSNDQVNTDAGLRKLTDNGGPTETIAFGLSSPALDMGVDGGVESDQRGAKRPVVFPDVTQPAGGDGSDVGAYELQSLPGDTGRRIDARARKRTVSAGRETCITFKARRKVHGQVRGPLRNVTVEFGLETKTTGRKGKVRFCGSWDKPGTVTAQFSKNTFKPATVSVRVVAR